MRKQVTITSIAVVLSIFATSAFGGPQVLEVSPSTLDFSAIEGGANPAAQVVSIWNSGPGTLNWEISEDCNWLTVEPNTGSSTGEVDDVNLSVDISGLAVGIYDCNLTVSDANAPNSPQMVDVELVVYDPNFVSWWKFNEGTGTIAYDSAGYNHGNLINGPNWTTGMIDGALEFDGVDDYVSLSQNAITTTEFTLAAWANHYGPGGGETNTNRLFSQRDASVGNNHCAISLNSENAIGTARAVIRSSSGSVQFLDAPKKDYNEWHHYAMTIDSADFIFYIDGVEVNRTTNNQSGNYITSIDYVDIGRGKSVEGDLAFFNGAIDETRIYDRALSAEEVSQLCEEGLGGRAFNPEPYDGASGVEINVVLRWSAGLYAADVNGHDVYFGTDYNEVNDATTGSAEYMGRQDANSWDSSNYDANGLGLETTYYWRIDEVNESEVNSPWKGNIWSFKTMGIVIGLSATQFNFTANEGGPNPDDQILSISNTGGGILNWQASESCSWLIVDPNNGSSTGETDDVNLSIDITGLDAGMYNCDLIVSDPNAENSPQTVSVTLDVQGPVIELSETHFDFIFPLVGGDPPSQILEINNNGTGILNWTIDYDCNWLDVYPTSGSSTGDVNEIILSVDTNGLDPNSSYPCVLTVSDPNAENSPQTVYVNLHPLCPGDVTDTVTGWVIELPPFGYDYFDITLWEGPDGRLNSSDVQALIYLLDYEGGSVNPVPTAALAGDVTGTVTGWVVGGPPDFIDYFDMSLWEGPNGTINSTDVQALIFLLTDSVGSYTCP